MHEIDKTYFDKMPIEILKLLINKSTQIRNMGEMCWVKQNKNFEIDENKNVLGETSP